MAKQIYTTVFTSNASNTAIKSKDICHVCNERKEVILVPVPGYQALCAICVVLNKRRIGAAKDYENDIRCSNKDCNRYGCTKLKNGLLVCRDCNVIK